MAGAVINMAVSAAARRKREMGDTAIPLGRLAEFEIRRLAQHKTHVAATLFQSMARTYEGKAELVFQRPKGVVYKTQCVRLIMN
ncbi:hypothetical protein GCM10009113_21000 [Marinobacter szutsaonensis]